MNSSIEKRDRFIADIRAIIEEGRRQAYNFAANILTMTYWNVGRRIVEEEQSGEARAEYGKELLSKLSAELTHEFGNNYTARRLRDYRQFYLYFKDIEIWHSRVPNLTWTHFKRLLAVPNVSAREWYMKEASDQMWSVRTLDRNISTQYYERRLACQREHLSLPAPDIG